MNLTEEHAAIRKALRRFGCIYPYREPLLSEPSTPYQSVLIVTEPVERRAIPRRPTSPQAAPLSPLPTGPSALELALLSRPTALLAPVSAAPPSALALLAPAPAEVTSPAKTGRRKVEIHPASTSSNVQPPSALQISPARELAATLRERGHKIFMKEEKIFVSDASMLTEEERATFKEHRQEMISLADPWVEEKATSLSIFLGHVPIAQDTDWQPQEPPDISNLHDIIVNFETDGLDWVHGHRPIGVTIGSIDGQMKRYLPFAHRGGGNLDEATIIRFLEREVRGKHITNINIRFDIHMARMLGIDFEEQGNTVTDIAHTAALLDDSRRKFALDVLAKDLIPGGVSIGRVDESMMSDYHSSKVGHRAEYQAVLVAQLRAIMYPQIEEQDLRPVHDLEDEVIYPVVEMEKNGAPIDMELLEYYSIECNKRHDDLLWEVAREVGFAFDHTPSSWRRLFEHFSFPVTYLPTTDKRKDKKETFADGIISRIDHPTIKKARLASQLASLNSKTFKPYKEIIGPDGILHYDINQLRGEEGGTVSGRFSIGYVQQVPNYGNHYVVFGDELFPRKLYLPASGNQYLEADAAQIQYRIFAHHANNPDVIRAYQENPEASFHKMIMAKIEPYKPDIIYEELKAMNFMITFGGKLLKIATMMGYITEGEAEEIRIRKAWRTDSRLDQAREIERIYDREMPEVKPLLQKSSHLAMSYCDDYCNKTQESRRLHKLYPHRGYVKTIKGRRSRFPNNNRLHKAFCMVDQGSEGDIMKTKLVELHKARKDTGFLLRMTVHDAVGGDAQAPETKEKVSEILNRQSFPELKVPIIWECGTGANWAECKG